MTKDRAVKIVGDTYENVFYVTNIQRASLARQIQTSLANAIDDGLSFEDWKLTDPIKTVKSLSDAQKQTVFRNNLNTAYHDGIKEDSRATGGFLRYSAVLDSRVRPSHEKLHDTTLPASDSFWDRYAPPNDHNCRCVAVPVSKARAERLGLKTPRDKVNKNVKAFKKAGGGKSFVGSSLLNDSSKKLMDQRLEKVPSQISRGIRSGTKRVLNKIKQLKESLLRRN